MRKLVEVLSIDCPATILPRFTPLEIKLIEAKRDKEVNPMKNAREQLAYEQDKALLIKRRRDRYVQSFIPGDD